MIILLLLLAFVLRLAFLSLPSFVTDMNSWISWANHMVAVGPVGFYQTIWSDYAPGYLYVLWFLGWIHRLISDIPFEWLLKLPAVIADVGIGLIIYKVSRGVRPLGNSRSDPNISGTTAALVAASLYLFNPAVIFNSVIWGQVDAVSTFFVVAAVVVLSDRSRFVPPSDECIAHIGGVTRAISGFFLLGFATVVKPQSLIFFLLLILQGIVKNKRKEKSFNILHSAFYILFLMFIFFLPVFLLSWPFFVSSPLTGLVKHLAESASTYPYASVNAMNLWGVFANWKVDSSTFLSFSYGVWGLTLFSIMYLVLSIKYFYNKSDKNFFLSLALIAVSFFMLLTRMHERYLHPFFALLPLAILEIRKIRRILLIYVGFTVLHFFNLYYAYSYYNHNLLRIDAITNFVRKYFGWFSAVTVILYGILVLYLVQLTYQKRTTSS